MFHGFGLRIALRPFERCAQEELMLNESVRAVVPETRWSRNENAKAMHGIRGDCG